MSDNKEVSRRDQFIEAVLVHVPFEGWSMAAFEAAGDACAFEVGEFDRLFPGGCDAVITAYADWVNRQMARQFLDKYGDDEIEAMPVHKRIRALILIRLEQVAGHKEAVRRTYSYFGKPQNAFLASQILYRLVDHIWRLAGDQSTDYNFYTKRATLAAVYGSVMLAFLGDNNADMEKVTAFLDRRLADVARIPKLTAPIGGGARLAYSLGCGLTRRLFMGRQATQKSHR